MKMLRLSIALVIVLFIGTSIQMNAQTRIAFFPFDNVDGNIERNIWSYNLRDSLEKALSNHELAGKNFVIVPSDSVEMLLAEYNIDPNSQEYESDMWKVAKELNVDKVITGDFNYHGNRYLINAFIFDVNTKLPDVDFQAKNIFKKEKKIYQSIKIIIKKLMPFFA